MTSQPSTLNQEPITVRGVGARKWPRLLLWVAAFCFLLSTFCFVFRAPLLTGLANAWMVNDPTVKSDAIVVLGGGLEYRPFAAASLYSNGCASTILITQPELPPTAQLGLTIPEFVTAREVLLKLGVPAGAIQMLGTNVTSTRDEALALKQWAQDHHAHSVVIPTDIFHTRRVRWIFQKALRDVRIPASSPVVSSPVARGPPSSRACEVHVTAIAPPRYTAKDWWNHEEGLIAFQNEVVKSVYYHLKY